MASRRTFALCAAAVLCAGGATRGIEPADPNLIPEGRALLGYLEGIHGRRVLTGINGVRNAEKVHQVCGRHAAVLSVDISGRRNPTWGSKYLRVARKNVAAAKAWWEAGGIVAMQFHWKHPLKADGKAWAGKPPRGSGRFDIAAALRPGTPEHEAVLRDLDRTAELLGGLHKARVPVLWRPLHQIDGGWFWWTDKDAPENTAALWRLMFDRFVNEHGLHNLIWVYSTGLRVGTGRDVEQVALRRRYYPGGSYVDIAGMDVYMNRWYGWGPYRATCYPRAMRIMRQVAPGKMLALSECGAIPSPDRMASAGPAWLYCLASFVGGKHNPCQWIRETYAHPLTVTREELPALGRRRVASTGPAE